MLFSSPWLLFSSISPYIWLWSMCIQYSTYVCLYNDVRRVCRQPAAVLHIKMTVRKFKKEIKNLITNIVFRWLGCSDLSWTGGEGGHAAKHNSMQIEIKSFLKPFGLMHTLSWSLFTWQIIPCLSSSLWRLSWFYIMTAQEGGACVLYTHRREKLFVLLPFTRESPHTGSLHYSSAHSLRTACGE